MEKLTSENVEEFIYEYSTKHKQGFTVYEINTILEEYGIDKNNFYTALGVNTCMIIDNEFITYHCDVLKGLRCVIENREQTFEEWD